MDEGLLALRPIVLARQKPRPLFVQPVIRRGDHERGSRTPAGRPAGRALTGGAPAGPVELVEFESSPAGLVQSFLERFPSDDDTDELLEATQRDERHFRLSSP